MKRKSTLVDSVSAESEVSAVGRKRLSSVVIPQNKANRLRNVSSEPVYAAPLARRSQSPARRSQSPTRRRATFNSSLFTAFAVLLCLLFSATAWGQTTYTSYTYDDGTSSYASDQSPAKLIDNQKTAGSKWCVTSFSSYSPIYVEFHSAEPIVPIGYVMTTGGDCASWTGRNPRSWTIKAKRNSGDSWTTIETQSSNAMLQDVNLKDYIFNLNNTNTYQYFRFEVSAIASGTTFQLTELQFLVGEKLTVNDGSATNQYIPMYGFYFDDYTKSECIIPASQLSSMTGATINSITFYPSFVGTTNTTWTNTNQQVFLKEVSGTTLGGSYSGTSSATTVYDGLLAMPTTSANGYTITFSQGYTYNGGNLLIGVYNTDDDTYNKVEWYGVGNLSSGVSAYGSNSSALNSVGYNAQSFLPKTTFNYTLPVANFPLKIVASNPAADEMTWAQFTENVSNGRTYAGYTVKLMEDIDVTTMAGTYTKSNGSYKPFKGIFDGQGHTITINVSGQGRFAAPFKCVENATIMNLHTAGSIDGNYHSENDGKILAGVVGVCYGNTVVRGCHSSVTLTTTKGEDAALAGIVAAQKGGNLTIEGCVFDGAMTGSSNTRCAGIMGYSYPENNGVCTVTNSFFAPTTLTVSQTNDNNDYPASTISRAGTSPSVSNCYYTQVLCRVQGTKAHKITGVNQVTVAMGGSATANYEAIGLSFYSGGLVYNDIIYGGNGNNLSLSLGTSAGGAVSGYSASAGTLSGTATTGSDDAYTLTMPSENVVISASLCEAITSFPWTETFESYGSGNFVAPCWVNEHISGSDTNIFNITTSGNGNSTHQIYLPDMSSGTLTKLVLPEMNFGAVSTEYQFLIDVYRSNSTYNSNNIYEGVRVYASTDGNIVGATEICFIPRQYNTSNAIIPEESSVGWYTYELNIPITTGTCYIILQGESQYCTSTYMDNFEVKVAPSCRTSISTFAEWQEFCSNVNSGTCSYAGRTVTLENGISITTTSLSDLVGTSDHPFKGTFDGQGNKLTVNINISGTADSYQGAAPFSHISGATIENLEVDGTVQAQAHHAGGLVSKAVGSNENTIRNCLVHTDVTNNNAGVNNTNFIGGIIGQNDVATTNIIGCVYDGTLTSQAFKGGMFGFTNAATITIQDSYFAGDYDINGLASGYGSFSPVGCRSASTFTLNLTLSNFYYNMGDGTFASEHSGYNANTNSTRTGTAKQAYKVTGAPGVTVAKNGFPTEYDVSGIDAYTAGIVYDGNIYGGNGDNIDLYLSYGSTFAEYVADHGTLSGSTVTGSNDEYTLAMTANNTVISVSNCATPTGLDVTNIMPTSATLNWSGDAGQYNVRYRSKKGFHYGFESAEPWAVDDFSPCTTYDGDGKDTYYFDSWNFPNQSYTGACIAFNNDNEGSTMYSHAGDAFGVMFNPADGSQANDWFILPELTIESGYVFSFWAREITDQYGDEVMNVGVLGSTPGTFSSNLASTIAVSGTAWTQYSYNLSAYVGQNIKLAINCVSTDIFGLMIDDIFVGNPSDDSWDEVILGVSYPYTITGLTPETEYEVQVQADCGGDGESLWTGTTFTTPDPCSKPHDLSAEDITATSATLNWIGAQQSYDVKYREVITAPVEYTYDFEDGTTQGWTTIDADGHGDAWSVDDYSGNIGSYCMKATYDWNYDHQDYLVSPEIPLGGTLSFFAKRYSPSYTDKFRVYLSTSGNNSSDFTIELTNGDVTPNTSYDEYTYDLSAYSGTGYVAIVYNAPANQYYLYIDDITIVKPGEYGNWITLNGVTSPSTITGLSPETNYEWQVQGVNCDGLGATTDWSDLSYFNIPPAYTVYATAYPTVGGSITGEGFSNGSGIYTEGSSVTLTATANTGYQFVNWTASNGSVVSANASYTFTVTGDVTYQANFTKTTATQLPWTENFDNGYSCASGAWVYLHGEWATPLRHEKTPNVTNYDWGAYSDHYCLEMRANNSDNMVVLPQFDEPLNKLKVSFRIGRGVTEDGYIVKLGYVTDPSDASTFIALSDISTPSNGVSNNLDDFDLFTCDLTTNNNAPSSSEYRLAIKYTMSGEDSWYLDNFDVRRVYTIAVSDNPSSSSSSLSGAGKYSHGETCTVTATPGDCYNFVNWTENGTEVSTSASYSFTAEADRNLVANFTQWTLNIDNNQTSLECINTGTEVVLTASATSNATPTYEWAVSSGSTEGTASSNTYTVSPTALSNTYTVSATVGGCERTQTATITTKPVITSGPSSSEGNEFCLGVSTNLSVESNAPSFTWDNGAGSGSPVTVTPTATTTYKVSATSGSCVSTSSITITINTPDITDYDYIWRGVSDDWNTAENWYMYSEGNYSVALALPSETKNYYIGTGDCLPSSQWPSLSADATIGNVTIDGGSVTVPDGVTLSIAGTISGALTAEEGSTIEFVGSSDQTISGSQTFSNVKFSKGGANVITATNGLAVNGTATFTSGIVSGNVTFGEGGSSAGANLNSYVDGTVTKTGNGNSFTFPTGSDGVLGTITATITSGESAVAKFNHKSSGFDQEHDGYPRWWNVADMCGAEPFNHVSNFEYWDFNTTADLSGVTFVSKASSADAHFHNPSEYPADDSDIIQIAVYDGCWKNIGGHLEMSDENKTITISGVNASRGTTRSGSAITTFGSKDPSVVLPIELTSFTATCDGRSALVEWTTASEKNNDYFSLERSDDAINFTEVARVAGAGNSIEPIDYAYNDYGIHGGDNYYRLVQVDYDGTRTVSEVVVANCIEESEGDPDVMAYPNPFNGELTVVLDNFGDRPAQIEVYDMLGKLVYTNKIAAPQNSYETILNLSNLPPAAYTVRVSTNDFVINRNVVKN